MVSLCNADAIIRNKKGSLSIETAICSTAVLYFVVFIIFILKLASLDLLLNALSVDITSEIAANSRIIAIANSIEKEGSVVEEIEGFSACISKYAGEIAVHKVLSEKIKCYNLPGWVNVNIGRIHLPCCGVKDGGHKEEDTEICEIQKKYGITLCEDDVAVVLESSVKVNLPLLYRCNILLTHMAVERGWVKGEADMFPLLTKPASLEPEPGKYADLTVYVTKTGTRYHKYDCRYLAKSSIMMKLKQAVDRGYVRCLICGGGVPIDLPIDEDEDEDEDD